MTPITVCLLTFNSERRLRDCLNGILKVADEVVVVDSGSTDQTLAILEEYGLNPINRAYRAHADQMNFAIRQARHDWVLCIDSDEVLDSQTCAAINALKAELAEPTTAYRLRRQWYVLGRPVHAIYPVSSPDYPVRLFNKQVARFNNAPVDDKPVGHLRTEILRGEVEHDTFFSLHEVFGKLNGYTTQLCQHTPPKPSLLRALTSPWFAFAKWYLIKGGWKDGKTGVIAALYAFAYTALKYLKAWYGAHYPNRLK